MAFTSFINYRRFQVNLKKGHAERGSNMRKGNIAVIPPPCTQKIQEILPKESMTYFSLKLCYSLDCAGLRTYFFYQKMSSQ